MQNLMLYIYLTISTSIIVVVFFLIRSKVTKLVQSKEEKREAIVQSYKQELKEALSPLNSDNDARVAKKMALLQRFNNELAANIFFDNSEIHQILLELSKEE